VIAFLKGFGACFDIKNQKKLFTGGEVFTVKSGETNKKGDHRF